MTTPRLSRDDAARYLRDTHNRRCQSAYLAKLANIGGGPRYFRSEGRVVYLQTDLDEWAALSLKLKGPYLRASDEGIQAGALDSEAA